VSMQATIVPYALAYVLADVWAWSLAATYNLRWHENLGPAKSTQR